MFVGSAAAAVFVATLALCAATPQSRVANSGQAEKLDCVFGKAGAASKVHIRLDGKKPADNNDVFLGRIWLDRKLLFPGSIKFLYSKNDDGKATLGAGVLTQKRTLFYTEMFIELDPESGAATFEAATTGVSTTLSGRCTSK
jgi:hypothetical protein